MALELSRFSLRELPPKRIYQCTFAPPVDSPTHRLPNTLNVSFVGRAGAGILARLDGIAATVGSACHSGSIELSPVLQAMGIAPEVGMGAVRFSLGRGTARDDIDVVVERLTQALAAAE